MKPTTTIKTLIAASIIAITTGSASADSGKKELSGFASGLAAGAVVGGPPGAIIGAIIGTLTGKSLDEKDVQEVKLTALESEIVVTREQLSLANQAANNPKLVKVAHQQFAQQLSSDLSIDLMFRTNSSTLEPQAHSKMTPVASLMAAFPELSVNLQGFADSRGKEEENQKLSSQRANSVKQALMSMGVSEEKIKIEAFGERFASATDTDLEGAAIDRHVTLRFVTGQQANSVVSNF
jgi:sortase system peptidoglycan-associated protein